MYHESGLRVIAHFSQCRQCVRIVGIPVSRYMYLPITEGYYNILITENIGKSIIYYMRVHTVVGTVL